MRSALIFALLVIGCGDSTADAPNLDQTAQPPASDGGARVVPIDVPIDTNDPNAPCRTECTDGSWCSYGRCVIN